MSEDDKPIFPRPNETSNEEKQKLYRETKQKLEAEEKTVEASFIKIYCSNCQAENNSNAKFCRVCGRELTSPEIPPTIFSPMQTKEEKLSPPPPMYGPPPLEFDEPVAIMYGPAPLMIDEPPPNTEELPNLNKLTPDEIHTTMYGPAPMLLDELPKTTPELKVDKEGGILKGLDYEEWKGRIPWLVIGGVIGFLIASVIILAIVLLVVAIR
jgi:ribosomal protein L40E